MKSIKVADMRHFAVLMQIACLIVVLLLAWAPAESAAAGRVWTDRAGKRIEAEFVRVYNAYVYLKVGDKVESFLISSLSDEDRDYIRQKLSGPQVTDGEPARVETPLRREFLLFGSKIITNMEAEADVWEIPPHRPHRAWTDTTGNNILGYYVSVEPPKIRIRTAEGQDLSYPLAVFDARDLAYVMEEDPKALQFSPSLVFALPSASGGPNGTLPGRQPVAVTPPTVARAATDTTRAGVEPEAAVSNPSNPSSQAAAAPQPATASETGTASQPAPASQAAPSESAASQPAVEIASSAPVAPAAPPVVVEEEERPKTFHVPPTSIWNRWWFYPSIIAAVGVLASIYFFRERLLAVVGSIMERFGGSRY